MSCRRTGSHRVFRLKEINYWAIVFRGTVISCIPQVYPYVSVCASPASCSGWTDARTHCKWRVSRPCALSCELSDWRFAQNFCRKTGKLPIFEKSINLSKFQPHRHRAFRHYAASCELARYSSYSIPCCRRDTEKSIIRKNCNYWKIDNKWKFQP